MIITLEIYKRQNFPAVSQLLRSEVEPYLFNVTLGRFDKYSPLC